MKATLTLELDDLISQKIEEAIMATLSDFTAKLDAIDATVNQIVTEIEDLRNQVATGGMNEVDEAAALDRLSTLETRLAGIATPTPPPVEEPPPAPEPLPEEGV